MSSRVWVAVLGPLAACALLGCAGATTRDEAPRLNAPALDAASLDAHVITTAQPPDLDDDGLAGEADHCPQEAEDCDGFQDDDGCPELDNDRDAVADACDRCPMEPETYNGRYDDDGCPESVGASVDGGRIARNRRVAFGIVDSAQGPALRWEGSQYVALAPPSPSTLPSPTDPLASCPEAREYVRRPGGCGSQ